MFGIKLFFPGKAKSRKSQDSSMNIFFATEQASFLFKTLSFFKVELHAGLLRPVLVWVITGSVLYPVGQAVNNKKTAPSPLHSLPTREHWQLDFLLYTINKDGQTTTTFTHCDKLKHCHHCKKKKKGGGVLLISKRFLLYFWRRKCSQTCKGVRKAVTGRSQSAQLQGGAN